MPETGRPSGTAAPGPSRARLAWYVLQGGCPKHAGVAVVEGEPVGRTGWTGCIARSRLFLGLIMENLDEKQAKRFLAEFSGVWAYTPYYGKYRASGRWY